MHYVIADVIQPTAVVVEWDDRARRAVLEFVSGERRTVTPPNGVTVAIGVKVRVIDTGAGPPAIAWDFAPTGD